MDRSLLNTAFQNILSSDVSAFVVIDHQTAFASCFAAKDVKATELAVSALLGAASDLNVPVIASVVETNRIKSKLSSLLDNTLGEVLCLGRSMTNPWDDSAFVSAIETANRPKLLLAGLSAECSLSVTALCALEQGFDVYVVRDACLGFSKETLEASFERLKQAGAVIVSWRQVVNEWHQGRLDGSLLRRYLKTKRGDRKPTPKAD